MASHTSTRRGVLGAIAAIPTLTVIGTAACAPLGDPTEAAFADWKAMLISIHEHGAGGENYEGPEWARMDAAEFAIMRAPAATIRVAEMRLWVALQHTLYGREATPAIAREDIDGVLATNADRDWNEKFLVNAIASLRGRQPVA